MLLDLLAMVLGLHRHGFEKWQSILPDSDRPGAKPCDEWTAASFQRRTCRACGLIQQRQVGYMVLDDVKSVPVKPSTTS